MYENSFLNPAYITPEEQQILDGDIAVQKNLYTSKQDFVVESNKFLEHSEDDITLRRHTRFVDFPKHKHDYVEIFYCLSGSVTHVINEEEIRLRPGELLFMNQHIEHAVIACGQEDLGINIIIRPAYFQNILTLINKDNILADFIINALEGDSCVGQYLYFTVSDNPCIQNLIHNAVFLLLQQPQNWHKLSEHTFALLFMHILSNAENILLDQKVSVSGV